MLYVSSLDGQRNGSSELRHSAQVTERISGERCLKPGRAEPLASAWCHVTCRYRPRTKTPGRAISAPAWVPLLCRRRSRGLWTRRLLRQRSLPAPSGPLTAFAPRPCPLRGAVLLARAALRLRSRRFRLWPDFKRCQSQALGATRTFASFGCSCPHPALPEAFLDARARREAPCAGVPWPVPCGPREWVPCRGALYRVLLFSGSISPSKNLEGCRCLVWGEEHVLLP